MGAVGGLRNDPRSWRLELLGQLVQLLSANATCAFILKDLAPDAPPTVVSLFDFGFRIDAQRESFLQEYNTAPFRDIFSRRMIERYLTALRSDLVDDAAWYVDGHMQTFRRAFGTDDCLMSLQRSTDRSTTYALCAFRPLAESAAGPGTPGTPPLHPAGIMDSAQALRFTARERVLLDLLHNGLRDIYRAEESMHRLTRADELSPRLRQTLECLLAGDTERQVAIKMSLSVHTVHDYVKALYTHFGVSSRGELLSKWMQTGGQLVRKES
jgi:DNA-binding CsgD family transcriptional regulator